VHLLLKQLHNQRPESAARHHAHHSLALFRALKGYEHLKGKSPAERRFAGWRDAPRARRRTRAASDAGRELGPPPHG
jgi:hypothetical protein